MRQEEAPMRFVDGELVERFLDCSSEVQEECIKGLMVDSVPVTVDAVKEMVEALRRLH
jgi:DNA damage-binding protein 1